MAINTDRARDCDDAAAEFGRRVARALPRAGGRNKMLNISGTRRNDVRLVTSGGKVVGSCLETPLAELLRRWERLPAAERHPQPPRVESGASRDARWAWADPPAGSLVLKVFTRSLDRDASNRLVRGVNRYPHRWSNQDTIRDFMWVTQAEWKAMIPAEPKRGARLSVPVSFEERLFKYYTRGDFYTARPWRRAEIRSGGLSLTVARVTADQVRLVLEGRVVLASLADVASAPERYRGGVRAMLTYDRGHKRFTRFDMLAIGALRWWNRPRFSVGVAFSLTDPDKGFSRMPPGRRWSKSRKYLGSGRYAPWRKPRPPAQGLLARLVQIDPEQFGKLDVAALSKLTKIDLSGNMDVTDALFADLASLASLKTLNLDDAEGVTNRAMVHIGKLSGLTELRLAHTWITDGGLSHLAGLKQLKVLSVADNFYITKHGLARIVAGCPNLERLDLAGVRIHDGDMKALARLTRLEHLRLGCDIRLSDRALTNLVDVRSLRTLDLVELGAMSAAGLARFRKLRQDCKVIGTRHSPR